MAEATKPDSTAAAAPAALSIAGYTELPLSEIVRYPMLDQCYAAWVKAGQGGRLPAAIDAADLPKDVIPYLMLLDYLPEQRDVRVRLAGNFVGERLSNDEGGRRLRNFFNEHDARIVFASMEQVANTRMPSLAHRSYVAIDGRTMEYVRLIMPLSADGGGVTGFFKTIEPATLHSEPPLEDADDAPA